MTDWPIVTVEELAAKSKGALATGPFGSSIGSKTFRESGVPVIRGGNLSQDIGKRLDDVGLVFVDEVLAKEFSRSVAVEGDLVFTCWGTINQVGLIDERASFPRYIVSNKQMKLTVDQDKALPLFLYYFFSSPLGQHQIEMNAIGSSVPGFNLSKLRSIPVPLPPLRVQKQIVALLGSLDDKIELNRRMNETLEAMAQVIFRDWFVDFGPTRRKLEGATDPLTIMGGLVQDSERAQALADLFPAALGDDGLPEGWTFGRLEDVLELAYGKALPKGERRDGTIPVYGSGGVGGFHDTALVSGPSVIVGRKGTVGSLYWEDDDFYPIDTVFYVKSKLPMTYCYQLLQTLGLETMNTDAAVPGLNRNNAYRLEVPQPYNSKLLSEFGEIADVLRSKITANVRENRTLAATRDLLLPKLMSGEVRLSAASEAVT